MPRTKKSNFQIMIDTRERKPWDFPRCKTRKATLDVGDYSIYGYKKFIVVERKAWWDFIGCISTTKRRDKFFSGQVAKLLKIEKSMIVVEGPPNFTNPRTKRYDRAIEPIMYNGVAQLSAMGLPVFVSQTVPQARNVALHFLHHAMKQMEQR